MYKASFIALSFFFLKIPHLQDLGINAVELLPVFEFDELELQRRSNPRDHMVITNQQFTFLCAYNISCRSYRNGSYKILPFSI
jgi:hypothetical protein